MRSRAWVLVAAALCLQAQPSRPHRFTLANGLRVIHLEAQGHPMIRVWLHLRKVPGDIPPGQGGLDALALRMLDRGWAADIRTGEADRLLEDAGILLTVDPAPEGITWKLLARNREQDLALGLLADRVLRPIFDPAALEAQRLACWQTFLAPSALGPLLRLDPALRPTEASLGRLGLDDLLAFQRRVFRPERAVLVLQGDLGLEQAKRLVALSLGTWSPAGAGVTPIPPPAPGGPAGTTLLTQLAPGPRLRLEAVAPRPPEVSPEVAALLAILLQGEPDLQVTLQELCLQQTLLPVGPDGAATALAALHAHLASLRARTVGAEELALAQGAWIKAQSLRTLDPEARMDAALAEALGRAPLADRVAAVSLEALTAGLRAWLAPAQVRLGAAGPRAGLAELTR